MAGFADREGKRAASIVAGMISTAPAPAAEEPRKRAAEPEQLEKTQEEASVKRNTTLYMRDDIINDAKALSFIKKVSMSNIVESALKAYIDENREMLEAYKKLFG